mmetsp:Transcript_8488/g.13948  ORF Transcript_8488/g.13948 Transcript_8488/m.13948 type:complete len:426 (-) Transcript_8488:786-2063(-)
MDYLDLCFPLSPSNSEAENIISKLQTNPINIFWWRRCMGNVLAKSTRDLSPFPREWSANYIENEEKTTVKRELFLQESIENEKANLLHALTDDSSEYSTLSQENRANRDEFGNCRLHPHVQLAKKKKANRFKIFTNSIDREEEWIILRHKCPECEKRRRDGSKAQIITNSDRLSVSSESFNIAVYNAIPASMTLVLSHPKLEGEIALRVRTEPLPLETIQTISCQTPDGVLDCVIPCDCNGAALETTGDSEYQIMERYIPLAHIDHVSRGGDAWDVLRQSTGEDDMGCNCDLKIHGFSDRLLRFDVVDFDEGTSDNFSKGGIRYSFANPDFRNSSITTSMNSREASLRNQQANFIGGNYSLENVISDLNYLALSDRKRRKAGIKYLLTNVSSWVDEVCGLGVPTTGNSSSTTKSRNITERNSRLP